MASADGPDVEGVDVEGMREYLGGTEIAFAILFGSHVRGNADEASDVDVALGFPGGMDAREQFRLRNRIDAHLQEYAEQFVDVSDVDSLPTSVAYAALRDGVVLVGDERSVESYRTQVERAYEESADERERERREFIDRLARGDA